MDFASLLFIIYLGYKIYDEFKEEKKWFFQNLRY
jgi:hypothetical protein